MMMTKTAKENVLGRPVMRETDFAIWVYILLFAMRHVAPVQRLVKHAQRLCSPSPLQSDQFCATKGDKAMER
jgi:hypothetical protein